MSYHQQGERSLDHTCGWIQLLIVMRLRIEGNRADGAIKTTVEQHGSENTETVQNIILSIHYIQINLSNESITVKTVTKNNFPKALSA